MKPNIELQIDQLILHGFSRRDAFYIGRAAERELNRLIQINGLPPGFSRDIRLRKLDAGAFDFQSGAKPEVIGRGIAGRVYGGLGNNKL